MNATNDGYKYAEIHLIEYAKHDCISSKSTIMSVNRKAACVRISDQRFLIQENNKLLSVLLEYIISYQRVTCTVVCSSV